MTSINSYFRFFRFFFLEKNYISLYILYCIVLHYIYLTTLKGLMIYLYYIIFEAYKSPLVMIIDVMSIDVHKVKLMRPLNHL